MVRLFSRPRTWGTMQYVQKLLQPVMMGTHAWKGLARWLGRSVEKGRPSSSVSTSTACPAPPSNASHSRSGRLASALVPKTTSAQGMCSRMRSPSRWAMQPPMATTRRPEGGSGALTMAEAWP